MINYRSTKRSQCINHIELALIYSNIIILKPPLSSTTAKLLAPDFAKPNLLAPKITKTAEPFTLVQGELGNITTLLANLHSI